MDEGNALAALDPSNLGPSNPDLAYNMDFIALLADSYQRLLGESLAPASLAPNKVPRWLYEAAPFCLLAHNQAADPRFVYANRTVLTCFGYEWEEMTRLPSRLSAEAPNRADRQRLIETVARDGFATGYRGVRIAKSGRRFWIEDVTMWQLTDATGVVRGQAAAFSSWRDA